MNTLPEGCTCTVTLPDLYCLLHKAAPDLLVALKADITDLKDFIDEYGEFPFSIDAAKGMIRRADAAIDKAEEKQA